MVRKLEKMYITTENGANTPMLVHAKESCGGRRCVIHNPSDHHMKKWPWLMRTDRSNLIERLCEHGIGHPDPDSLYFFTDIAKYGGESLSVHGCDGCCVLDRKE